MTRAKFRSFKERALKDEKVRREYDALSEEFAFAEELIKARISANMTQEEVAKIMHTSKSNISRLENVDSLNWPNLNTLKKYAEAVGCELKIKLKPLKKAA
ncbi:MAG: helix-turn-helix transcriptional regulator [Myxococcales bacterium]|nr:helix-turn-helix transcriptional regulator [Myxococcales bacterium]